MARRDKLSFASEQERLAWIDHVMEPVRRHYSQVKQPEILEAAFAQVTARMMILTGEEISQVRDDQKADL